jgi:hypothetical protein
MNAAHFDVSSLDDEDLEGLLLVLVMKRDLSILSTIRAHGLAVHQYKSDMVQARIVSLHVDMPNSQDLPLILNRTSASPGKIQERKSCLSLRGCPVAADER